MRYAIYGLGRYFLGNLPSFTNVLVDAVLFTDTSSAQRKRIHEAFGCPVVEPKILAEQEAVIDKVFIAAPGYIDEITHTLMEEYGYSAEKIEFLKPNERFLLPKNCFENASILLDREAALNAIPKGGICCEVGVAYGDFSDLILSEMKPEKFYAIDYFATENPYSATGINYLKRDNMTHRQWYENRFKAEITQGVVEVRQGISWECLTGFPDEFFDYAYIDAGHDYESVKKDIGAIDNKIKDGGFIQFNDYTPYCWNWSNNFYFVGIIPAVNEYINMSGGKCIIKYYCLDRSHSNSDIVVQVRKT